MGTDRYRWVRRKKTSDFGITPPYQSDQSDQSAPSDQSDQSDQSAPSDQSVCADGVRSVQSTRTLFTV